MFRNLDMATLRALVAVADTRGVTRAAGLLNLTQSAVSMQLKRLEELLDIELLDRSRRQIELTDAGELLLGYARRVIALNDEALSRLMDPGHEGELVLGVPHDIVYPVIPRVLQEFHAHYPRMQVNLLSSNTSALKRDFERGGIDAILTTEDTCDGGGETLVTLPLIWVGAPDGQAWRRKPLRVAFETSCLFRKGALRALDSANIAWEMAVNSESTRTVEAAVSADLAVHTALDGMLPPYMTPVPHGGELPELKSKMINLYSAPGRNSVPLEGMLELVRSGFRNTLGRDNDLSGRASAA